MSLQFRPVKEGRAVAQWVKDLKNKSGVYLIREKVGFLFFAGDVVYVGESHTDRLYSTLLRHFQRWTGKTAGATFAVSKVEVTVPAPQKIVAQLPPLPPIKRKTVGREDMANVFQRGTRSFSRTDAVAALKRLGFGKTAAYSALSPDGRFSAWLQCAPDGIITWTE
jgi:hypothetical protein